jgi:hypothetical protein
MLLFRLSRLLAVGGAAVVRLCEGRYGITRREWAVLSLLWEQQGQSPPSWPSGCSWTGPAPRARSASCC